MESYSYRSSRAAEVRIPFPVSFPAWYERTWDPSHHVSDGTADALTGITGVDPNSLYYHPNDMWTGDTGFADSGSPQFLTGHAVSLQTFPGGQAQRLETVPELSFLNGILAGRDCPWE